MEDMSARKFFLSLLLLLFLLFSAIAAFNALVDANRLFSAPEIKGFNYFKPAFFLGQFVSKPYIVRKRRPDGIILGTSRAGASMNTEHPAWNGFRAYNFALPGVTAQIQWWNFQHASAQSPLRRVVMGLDFFMFNSCRDQSMEPHYQEYKQRLAAVDGSMNWSYLPRVLTDYFSELTSFSSTRTSWTTWRAQTLFAQRRGPFLHLHDDGFWSSIPQQEVSQRRAFFKTEQHHISSEWFPQPRGCYSLAVDGKKIQLAHLESLLLEAHRQNIPVILYFSPFHARFAEAMVAVGLWEKFEQWKREVLALNIRSARMASAEAFPLWDFSGYNAITTEDIPSLSSITRMKYFLDGTHSTPLTGMMVQDVIFDMRFSEREIPVDFGVQLSEQNIEEQILLTREFQQQYRQQHSAQFEDLVKTAAKYSRSSGTGL